MKKVIMISFAAVAALLFFLNVDLNLNGNKVEGMNLSTNTQIAQAFDHCELEFDDFLCYCESHDGYCGEVCSTIYVRRCWNPEGK